MGILADILNCLEYCAKAKSQDNTKGNKRRKLCWKARKYKKAVMVRGNANPSPPFGTSSEKSLAGSAKKAEEMLG